MSKKVTIVTEKRNRAGSILILPEIGETQIGEDGTVEVPENVAAHLIETGLGWAYQGDAPVVVEEEIVEPEVVVEAEVEPEVVAEAEPEDEESIDLNNLTVAKLKDICEDAGLPASSWSSMNKKKLIKYIENKIN